MTTETVGVSPALEVVTLAQEIEVELDFAFGYHQIDELLKLQTVLGLVRRLLHKRDYFNNSGVVKEFKVPLIREERCIGSILKSKIAPEAMVICETNERTGRTIATFKQVGANCIDRLIDVSLTEVRKGLTAYKEKNG